jgi:endoplasmic reticulum junction formation protein lunapark
MVSLWPFRVSPPFRIHKLNANLQVQRGSTSAESFEKTLSALATKISKQGTHNDKLRQRARRVKVSWTLYGGFAYILAALLLIFVTGKANWGVVEYSVLAGGPVL